MYGHETQRTYAISKFPQADYATPTDTADPDNFVKFQAADKNLAKHSVQTEDNQEDAQGHEQATEEYLLSHDVEAQRDFGVSSEQIGRHLYLATGAVTTTQPNAVGAPTVFQHVFQPMDAASGRQLPAATLIEIVGSALNRKFPSMVVNALSLKGDGQRRLQGNIDLRGSGKFIDPSGLTAADIDDMAEATGLHYLFNSQAVLTIADTGTLANAINYGTLGRLENWDFNYSNNLLLEDGYRPGAGKFFTANDPASGAIRAECLFGRRSFGANFLCRLDNTTDELAALRSRKALDFKIELTGAKIGATVFNHKLTIRALRVTYEMTELGEKNGIVTVAVKPKIFWDLSSDKVVELTVINEIESYQAAP